jgi:hypothetical protein
MQLQAHILGHVSPLSTEERRLGGDYNLQPGPVARAFEYWSVRLDKVEGTAAPARKAPAAKKTAPAKKAAAKPARKAKRSKAKRR